MNTDKIFAEQIANEYAPKDTSKIAALRRLDVRAKLPAEIFAYSFGVIVLTGIGVNYPVYKRILKKGKQKYTFVIMELAKEISDSRE